MTTRQEIDSIIEELESIIKELESICDGIQRDFQGIGQDHCVLSIKEQIGKYKKAKNKLENVDPSLIVEGYEAIVGG